MGSRPALPCPRWCTRNHANASATAGHHMTDRPMGDQGWVTLVMTDFGDAYPALVNTAGALDIQLYWRATDKTVARSLDESEQFAQEAEGLGRPDVAALIRELAALAKETPDAT